MSRLALIRLIPLLFAQPGMAAGMAPPSLSGVEPAAGADTTGMKGMDMSGAVQAPTLAVEPAPAEPDIPDTPPPPPPRDHAADYYYDPAAMAAARATLRQEHGGMVYSMVTANLAEYQAGPGGGGYRWDGEARIGGDIDQFVMKSEGDGSVRGGLGAAEVQGLYSHAVDPYFDVQAGVRQDLGPGSRTYATLGVEGLLPYWIEAQAAVFLSAEGELLARAEGTYDLRLTQRLILQPRAELNFAAQNTAETRTGLGLSNAELGLRLRYEIRRRFAPYIGVSYDRKLGRTADYARPRGVGPGGVTFVAGIRVWY